MGGLRTIARRRAFCLSTGLKLATMKNKYLLAFLFSFLFIPSIALASWWNPFSWFKKNPKPTIETTEKIKPKPSTIKVSEDTTATKATEKKVSNSKSNIVKEKSTKETVATSSIVSSPVPPVLDICKNIEGIQSGAPDGMIANQGTYLPSTINTDQQIAQIQESLNQIVKNTAPAVPPPVIIDNTPKEVKFEELAKFYMPNLGEDYVQLSVYAFKKDDVIKLLFKGETFTRIVKKDEGPSEMFEIHKLEPGTWYPYEIKVERGNLYGIRKAEFRTDFIKSN